MVRNRSYRRFKGSLTLNSTYIGWEDFQKKSGIENTDTHKLLFESLFYLFGDSYTIDDSIDYLTNKLKFHITNKGVKYDILSGEYMKNRDKFFKDIETVNQYSLGDRQLDGTEDFDNFQTGRQVTEDTKAKDYQQAYEKFMSYKNPLEMIINDLANVILLPVQEKPRKVSY